MRYPNRYALIMAGGRGTRFWPRSRRRRSKQVLQVFGKKSLIQQTAERIRPVVPPERTWVLTNRDLRPAIVAQLPAVPQRQIIAEPAQRNTGPCNALGAHIIAGIDPDAVVGVFPADHVITDRPAFTRVVQAAYAAAESSGNLVVVGIQPRWADDGYGYIEFPEGVRAGALEPVPVRSFREKPDKETAEKYVRAGNYYWNAGMFFWRASVFLEAVREYEPQTATLIASLPPVRSRGFASMLAKVYPAVRDISVDYAVYEKAGNVAGIPAGDLGWSDVGTWRSVYELLPHDENGNAVRGELVGIESSGNYVDAERKLVALVGVNDLVVVDTPDALLITRRDCAQKVGQVVKRLEAMKRGDLL